MAATKSRRKKAPRGTIDTLANGALRVRVDAGTDPVTKKRHRLTEIIPADAPDKEAEAEKTRIRLLGDVNERRNPRTRATLDQLLDRYLKNFEGAWSTRDHYRTLRKKHISPFIGQTKVGDLDADILDSLYAELRRCSDHCTRPYTQHRTSRKHVCDERCRPHRCSPLGTWGIRHVHWLLSGAYESARRWKWVTSNPVSDAAPPPPPPPNPQPPSTGDAARILNAAASRDLDWATLVWLAMTTGARRHELCALRWADLETEGAYAVLSIERGISKDEDGRWAELGTKTHQQRRVTLDPETVTVLAEHRDRCQQRLARLDVELSGDAFLFSAETDHSRFLTPGSVTHRYQRMVEQLGVKTTIHKLRHYSATELIKAGADINTVAGRLGHAGGGTTTLKVYTAFVSEADQRAAGELGARMPERNWRDADPVERAKTDPRAPYEVIAASLRVSILDGALVDGAPLPKVKELAGQHEVSVGTAQRALLLLRRWGMATEGGRGRRPTVIRPAPVETADTQPEPQFAISNCGPVLLEFRLLWLGEVVRTFSASADPANVEQLHRLLSGAARRHYGGPVGLDDYELEVYRNGTAELITTFVAT